jgi:hypothetical protein
MKATLRLDVSPSSGSAGAFLIRLGDRLHRRDAVAERRASSWAKGIDPNTVLEMRWSRSTEFALRGSVRRFPFTGLLQ